MNLPAAHREILCGALSRWTRPGCQMQTCRKLGLQTRGGTRTRPVRTGHCGCNLMLLCTPGKRLPRGQQPQDYGACCAPYRGFCKRHRQKPRRQWSLVIINNPGHHKKIYQSVAPIIVHAPAANLTREGARSLLPLSQFRVSRL